MALYSNILENYKIGKVLGQGGFGTVYSGIRIEDNLPVAIKEVSIKKISQWIVKRMEATGLKERVPLEIELLSKVNGIEGVIKMYEWFKMNQTIEEYIKGSVPDKNAIVFIIILERPEKCVDLFDYIGRRKRLKEDVAKKFFKQIFAAVKGCYDKGIVHRDVKDENIIVSLNDENKATQITLIDFGSGAFVKENDFLDFEGTKVFAPPEFFRDKKYNGEMATVWSLGVLLFSMLSGNTPWKEEEEIINASEADLWFPRGVEVSKSCNDLIRMCLSQDKTRRARLIDICNHEWMN